MSSLQSGSWADGRLRFRPLFGNPFTDIRRTISEFRSVCLAKSKKLHGLPVDKKNVLEIDGKATRFLFKYASKRIDMFSCNPAADDQQHEVFSADDSVDSAAHDGLPIVIPDWPSGSRELIRLFAAAKSFIRDSFLGLLRRQADIWRLRVLIGQMSVNRVADEPPGICSLLQYFFEILAEPQNRSPDRGPVTVPRIAEGSPVAGV